MSYREVFRVSDRMTDEERKAVEATRERRKAVADKGKHVEPKKQAETDKQSK